MSRAATTGSRARAPARGARLLFSVPALAGIALLIVAEFTTLVAVQVITVELGPIKAGDHHNYALLIIGIAALVMLVLSLLSRNRRGARSFSLAMVVLALAALGICLLKDYPILDEVGLVGERYDQAQAEAKIGFYLESLGAVLLLVSSVALTLFAGRGNDRESALERETARAQGDPAARRRRRRARESRLAERDADA